MSDFEHRPHGEPATWTTVPLSYTHPSPFEQRGQDIFIYIFLSSSLLGLKPCTGTRLFDLERRVIQRWRKLGLDWGCCWLASYRGSDPTSTDLYHSSSRWDNSYKGTVWGSDIETNSLLCSMHDRNAYLPIWSSLSLFYFFSAIKIVNILLCEHWWSIKLQIIFGDHHVFQGFRRVHRQVCMSPKARITEKIRQ